jgi:hypothetical protein
MPPWTANAISHEASGGYDQRVDPRNALARNVRLTAAFAYAGGVPVEAREMLAWDEMRASVGQRSAPASLLHLWKSGSRTQARAECCNPMKRGVSAEVPTTLAADEARIPGRAAAGLGITEAKREEPDLSNRA